MISNKAKRKKISENQHSHCLKRSIPLIVYFYALFLSDNIQKKFVSTVIWLPEIGTYTLNKQIVIKKEDFSSVK